jgi:hypothetical protein
MGDLPPFFFLSFFPFFERISIYHWTFLTRFFLLLNNLLSDSHVCYSKDSILAFALQSFVSLLLLTCTQGRVR